MSTRTTSTCNNSSSAKPCKNELLRPESCEPPQTRWEKRTPRTRWANQYLKKRNPPGMLGRPVLEKKNLKPLQTCWADQNLKKPDQYLKKPDPYPADPLGEPVLEKTRPLSPRPVGRKGTLKKNETLQTRWANQYLKTNPKPLQARWANQY